MFRRSFRSNSLIHILGGVVLASCNFLLAPVYLRLLSPSDFGVWSSYLLAVQVLQPMLCWGLLGAMSRLLVDADDERRPRLIGSGVRLSSALNILFLVCLWASLPVLQSWVADVEMQFLFLLAAVSSALSVYPAILMGLYVADNDAVRYRSVGLMGVGLQIASLIAVVLFTQLDAQGAVLAMLLGMGVYSFLAMSRLLSEQSGGRIKISDYTEVLIFGLPIMLYTLLGQASDFLIRSLLVVKVSRADFGSFSAGLLLASTVAMIASAVNLAWVPLYYRKAQAWSLSGVYSHFVEVIAAITALVAAFLIIFSDELLMVYSGGSVEMPSSSMAGLVIAAWLNSAVWMGVSNPLFQQKRTFSVLALAMAATVLSIPLSLLLVDQHGVLGAAWALASSALVLCVLAALLLRHLGFSSPQYSRLLLLLLLLIGLSGPWLDWLYLLDTHWLRLLYKLILMVTIAISVAVIFLSRILQLIKEIEFDISS